MNKWLLLSLAVLGEVSASLSLKAALTNPGWYTVVVTGYLIAFGLLALVLRAGLPLGVAYGIWGAMGVFLTAIFGAWIFGETLTILMLAGIALIICGVVLVEAGQEGRRSSTR